MDFSKEVREESSLVHIRQASPLVHCITNYVVSNVTANGLLAIGASPVMADELEEVQEMVSIAGGLLLNIGTLNARTTDSMLAAGKQANRLGIPVVLDPVGVGATSYRQRFVQRLLSEITFDLLRCNRGELAAIAGVAWQSRGVDSGEGSQDIKEIAKQVAKQYRCLVAVTGDWDYVTDGEREAMITGGDIRMTAVTGMGCLLSAICTAALALPGDRFKHLQGVLRDYKLAAEIAGAQPRIGSFQVEIMNALEQLSAGERL